jgi:hypothetical protein
VSGAGYYSSTSIVAAFPIENHAPLTPPFPHELIVSNYNDIGSYLSGIFTASPIVSPYVYPYESNFVTPLLPVISTAIQSFYDSIDLLVASASNSHTPRLPTNLQANNTGENYFMSNRIPTTPTYSGGNELFLYVLCLNQNSAGAGLTSNVQIYNAITTNEIPNGSIYTAPNLPNMNSNNPYPFASALEKSRFSDYYLYSYSLVDLNAETQGNALIVVERISYNPVNYNHTFYNSVHAAQLFVGPALTQPQISSLQTNYPGLNIQLDINVNPRALCFLEGTKILCFNAETNAEEYRAIETLRNADLVKTVKCGYKRVETVGRSKIYNAANTVRSRNRLYKCLKDRYPELDADLVVTGCHSILVKDITAEERRDLMDYQGQIYVTDGHYRLIACVDSRAEPYPEEGVFDIWHLALENDDYYMNYGIYANGLLVESSSRRMMKELSNMDIIV